METKVQRRFVCYLKAFYSEKGECIRLLLTQYSCSCIEYETFIYCITRSASVNVTFQTFPDSCKKYESVFQYESPYATKAQQSAQRKL